MQNVVGFVAAGLVEECIIQRFDVGVFMALAQSHARVFRVESLGALGTQINKVANITGLMGLAAAVDAAARTGHDFDEVVICLSRSHFVEKFGCIG